MISKNDILKFVRHVHRRGQGIPDRRAMHPRREWLIGLFIFLAVTGVGAILSMMTFENYKNIDKHVYAVDLATPVYNEVRTKTVLSDFSSRKHSYSAYINGIEVVRPEVAQTATTTSSTTVGFEDGTTATTTIGGVE